MRFRIKILTMGRDYRTHKTIKGLIALGLCLTTVFGTLLQERAFAAGKASEQATTGYDASSAQSGGELHAFYPSNAVFSDQLKEYIDAVDSLSFAWSRLDAEAPDELNTVKGKYGNKGFYYPADYTRVVEYAKSKGKPIQLNIYMDSSDGIQLLPFKDKRESMIGAITAFLKTEIVQGKGLYYDGVVIDFEGLRDTDMNGKELLYEGKPISTYFIQFLNELKAQLTTLSKYLYAAVNPGMYYDGYDYGGILKACDRVILMAHDYEPVGRLQKQQVNQYMGYDALEPIYSMAPILPIRQALNELAEEAPNQAELSKLWLQITFDSAQWRYDVNSKEDWENLPKDTLSREERLTPLYKSIKDRVDNKDGKGQNLTYGYNNELQTPYLQYYNTSDQSFNIILYEDSRSISAKLELAKAYGLGGISVWSLANVPDYTDSNGLKYRLDGWTTLLDKMKTFGEPDEKNRKTIVFKDPAVEQAVREKLGKPAGKITVFDLQGIYRLRLTKGVKNLADLKQLPQLEYLDAHQLGIKDITAVGSLKKLRVLYLQRNQITDISALKKLTKLEVLSLNGNTITNIKPLSKLTSLKKLYLRENKLTGVTALKGLINLTELYLKGNLITDYSSLKQVARKTGFLCDFKIK